MKSKKHHVLVKQLLVCGTVLAVLSGLTVASEPEAPPSQNIIKRIVWGERGFLGKLGAFTFETVVQREGQTGDTAGDFHKFGSAALTPAGFVVSEYAPAFMTPKKPTGVRRWPLLTPGFVQMIVPDVAGVDQSRYDWKYKGQELLGDVHCWVFDLTPNTAAGYGLFTGRIYISKNDLAIIRFDGTYTHDPRKPSPYLHFVSSRIKTGPDQLWMPASVYVEEHDTIRPIQGSTRLKARATFWGFHPIISTGNESTGIRIPKDQPAIVSKDLPTSPQVHDWYLEIESMVITWMEAHSLLAPKGNVDRVVEAVITNLVEASGVDYQWPIHARVVLTTPLEVFTIGDTVVISRGLIDVLGSESALALVLAPQVAHVLLGHHIDTNYSFPDRFLQPQDQVVQRLTFRRTAPEIGEADPLGLALFSKSSYKSKLADAALFLSGVTKNCQQMSTLFRPVFGNPIPGCNHPGPFDRLLELTPPAEDKQLPALPLGSRVRVDPWSGAIELIAPLQENAPFKLIALIPIPKESVQAQKEPTPLPPVPRESHSALPVLK